MKAFRCVRQLPPSAAASARALMPALVLGLSACFTEIGNPDPETSMTATLHVDAAAADSAGPGPEFVEISRFRLVFLGADYRGRDSVPGTLWEPADAGGGAVDFTAGDSLPRVRLAFDPVEMSVHFGSATEGAFHFLKGEYTLAGETRAFRFALPDTSAFTLRYDSTALESWRTGPEYRCEVVFLPRRWLSLPGLDTALADSAGIVRFDDAHNPALHEALVQRFFQSFNGERAYTGASSFPDP